MIFFLLPSKSLFSPNNKSENNIACCGCRVYRDMFHRAILSWRARGVDRLHLEDRPKDAGPDHPDDCTSRIILRPPDHRRSRHTKARSDRMRSAICIRARRRAVSVAARDYRTADYSTAIQCIVPGKRRLGLFFFLTFIHAANHDVRKLENPDNRD